MWLEFEFSLAVW